LDGKPLQWGAPVCDLTVGSDLTVIQSLQAPPRAAFDLYRLAESQSLDRVARYSLQRSAWTAAWQRGDDPLEMWHTLTAGTGRVVPQNVTYTLEHDWSDASRSATLGHALLLQFPSEAAAALARRDARVRKAVRTELSPTAWIMDPSRDAAICKALERLGIAAHIGSDAARTPRGSPAAEDPAQGEGAFRLPWPGPFGQAEGGLPPLAIHGRGVPKCAVPVSLVRMPAQAVYRRLQAAAEQGLDLWMELPEEGFVRFKPQRVTRRTLQGHCYGCGGEHTLDTTLVRSLLDRQALCAW